ncbi:MAG: ribosome biogenesis GTP-binding protein YihA/YsxC [Lachnospiraceae bacterium]|nr:ribosome biogenesis GTP-binding protein YihA/YsxC [Lachnospiraceae bacterium]
MKLRKVNLDIVCGITSTLPETGMPEYAFLGRSNVGKSSLINSLMQRKNYARTSSDPGKTQTINYYNINDELYLVDLPGYGYAKVSRSTRQKWGRMIERYLLNSSSLRLVFLLIDSRHAPTEDDRLMLEWLIYNSIPTAIIATKADKLKNSTRDAELDKLRSSLDGAENLEFISYSSVTGEGREEIYGLME